MRSQLRHSSLGNLPRRRTKPKVSADYAVGITDGEDKNELSDSRSAGKPHATWEHEVTQLS